MRRVLCTVAATAVLVVLAAPGAQAVTTASSATCSIRVSPPALRTSPLDPTIAISTQVAATCAGSMSFDLDVLSEIRYYGLEPDGPVLATSLGSFSEHGYPVTRYEDLWYRYAAPEGLYRGWADVVVTFPFGLSRQLPPGDGCEYLDSLHIYCSYLSAPTLLPPLN